ncbi:SDR family oxidoreductase [Mycobacterium malmoense]|uniref:Short-chain dehydrogenase n=1 Tax=Mycobacterium malmoense TaxID=1780 RepID=A0ABX3SZF2_MYCMA|nr:SDR family oxidoreductase [Mycobacterium malmoense]ORA85492.1 short-chain dehydrogenase [Mycobacterium malmoense]QZA17859.1 SDR family oxidoreductase [Mycobacterium malmoense]UNB94636.1 SDR family oxidoreductase [Mycobacterium malmoense]
MAREVLTVLGVGGMGNAIARRLGAGKTVLLADNNEAALASVADALAADGHRVDSRGVDVSSPESVRALAEHAASLGAVTQVAHTAGLSPSQASAAAILAVDLLGTALVLEEFGEVIAAGGAGVVIASMAGHMFPPPTAEQERALAHTPARELLGLDFASPQKITEPGVAYGIAKQANHIRVRAASAHWGRRGARVNSISPGIISTPMGQQELASPVGDGMRAMIAASATGRIGTPDDIASATAFLLGPDASFITGTDLLVDGGVIAAMKAGGPG